MLFNPILRHLNPRSSGLIVFKGGGGGAAPVSTGAGIAGTMDNTTGMEADGDIGATSTTTTTTAPPPPPPPAPTIDTSDLAKSAAMDSGFANVLGDTSNILADTGQIKSNVNTGFASIEDLLGQYNTASQQQFSNLSQGQTAGFQDMGNRFDTVDQATSNLQGTVDQGFVDQAQGFTDAQANRTANAAQADASFAAAGQAMDQGFADTSNQMTQTQANVLGGQAGIQTNLDNMSATADIYAAESMQNQEALQQGQDQFVSSFDDYTDRYGQDQKIATNSRNDIFEAQANQSEKLREDIGDYSQALQTGQKDLTTEIQERSVGLEEQFAEGLAGLDASQITQARDQARSASRLTNLEPAMRTKFSQLGASFNDEGQLIESSIDADGGTTNRSVDRTGNLLLNKFDVTGRSMGGTSINIRTSLQELSDLQGQSSGFASPFAQTG